MREAFAKESVLRPGATACMANIMDVAVPQARGTKTQIKTLITGFPERTQDHFHTHHALVEEFVFTTDRNLVTDRVVLCTG